MAWLVNDGFDLLLGEDGKKALEKLLAQFQQRIGQGDASEILQSIIDHPANAVDSVLLFLAKRLLGDEAAARIDILRAPLNRLEQRTEEKDRLIGWSDLTYEVAKSVGPVSLDIKAGGNAHFLVASGVDDLSAKMTFRANGSLAAGAGLSVNPARLGLSASARGQIARGVEYEFEYDDDLAAGLAVADAIRRIGAPLDDLARVKEEFYRAGSRTTLTTPLLTLKSIRITGGQAVRLAATASMSTALGPVPGTITVTGGASYARSSGFSLHLTPAQGGVSVEVKAEDADASDAEIGIAYRIGVGDLSPELVRRVVKTLKRGDDLLTEADKVLGEANKLFQPGAYLKENIKSWIDANLANGGPLDLLKNLTGLDNRGSIAEAVAEWVSQGIDEFEELLSARNRPAFIKRLVEKAASRAESELTGFLNSILGQAVQEIDTAVKSAAGAIGSDVLGELLGRGAVPPANAVDALREIIGKVRQHLVAIANGLSETGRDLFAAELAYRRSVTRAQEEVALAVFHTGTSASDLFRDIIRHPSSAVSRLIAAQGKSGVSVLKAEELTEHSDERNGSWRFSLLDFAVAGSVSSVNKLQVLRTLSGVTVAQERRIEKIRSFFGAERHMFAADFRSFGNANTTRFAVGISQEEEWEREETEKFLKSLVTNGLTISDAAQSGLLDHRALQGGRKPKGRLGVGLTLPPDVANLFIDGAPARFPDIGAMIDTKMAANPSLAKRASELLVAVAQYNLMPIAEQTKHCHYVRVDQDGAPQLDIAAALKDIVPLRKIASEAEKTATRNRAAGYREGEQVANNLAKFVNGLAESRNAFIRYIAELAAVRSEMRSLGGNIQDKDIESILNRESDVSTNLRDRWFEIGIPVSTKLNPRPVLLLVVTKKAVEMVTGITVPTVLSAQFGDGLPKYFVADL